MKICVVLNTNKMECQITYFINMLIALVVLLS